MATTIDNFFITTLIDRATGQSGRVRDMVNGTIASRAEWTDGDSTDDLPLARIYAATSGGGTLTLSSKLLAIGTEEAPYIITLLVESSGGSTTITCESPSTTIDGETDDLSLSGYGRHTLYSNGQGWFSI